MEKIKEYIQVSIVRYEALIEHKHLLELRVLELENHINNLESFLLRACDKANYDWVTIDIDDLKRLMTVKEDKEDD